MALLASVVVGWARPGWWRRAVVGLAAAPVPVLLFTSHRLLAAGALLALLLPACWLGRELAGRLLGEAERGAAWAIGGAFGLGIGAALGFALGLVGLLRRLRPAALLRLCVAGGRSRTIRPHRNQDLGKQVGADGC